MKRNRVGRHASTELVAHDRSQGPGTFYDVAVDGRFLFNLLVERTSPSAGSRRCVLRPRDTALQRGVAIKVLPE